MTRDRIKLSSICAFLFLSASACSVVVDSERVQCKTNSDCSAYGPAFAGYVCSKSICEPDPTWACLVNPVEELPPATSAHMSLKLVDLLTQKPLAGVHLTYCAKIDAACGTIMGHYYSNQAGEVDVESSSSFDGYFEADGEGLYPTLFFPPKAGRQIAPSTLPIVAASFFNVMFSGIGGGVSPDRTVIMTTALDCRGKPAAGVQLSTNQLDERSVSYVLEGGLPSRTATITDQSGVGGFVNIKPGTASITSTIAKTGELAGTVGVQTRPGHLTMVLVMPSKG